MKNQKETIKEYLVVNGRITGGYCIYKVTDIQTVMEVDSSTGKEYGAYYFKIG